MGVLTFTSNLWLNFMQICCGIIVKSESILGLRTVKLKWGLKKSVRSYLFPLMDEEFWEEIFRIWGGMARGSEVANPLVSLQFVNPQVCKIEMWSKCCE